MGDATVPPPILVVLAQELPVVQIPEYVHPFSHSGLRIHQRTPTRIVERGNASSLCRQLDQREDTDSLRNAEHSFKVRRDACQFPLRS